MKDWTLGDKWYRETPSGLSVVEVNPAVELIKTYHGGEWVGDDEQTRILIKDLTTYLVSQDTRTKLGRDIWKVGDFISELLAGFSEEGSLAHMTFNYGKQPAIVAYPLDKIEQMIGFGDRYSFESLPEEAIPKLDVPVIHSHWDTAGHLGLHGVNRPYQNEAGNMLYGRGSNDTLGSLAAGLVTIKELISQGNDRFVWLFTSDEEVEGNPHGKQLGRRLQSSVLNIDLEPTSVAEGVFSRGMATEVVTGYEIMSGVDPQELGGFIEDMNGKGINSYILEGKGGMDTLIIYVAVEEDRDGNGVVGRKAAIDLLGSAADIAENYKFVYSKCTPITDTMTIKGFDSGEIDERIIGIVRRALKDNYPLGEIKKQLTHVSSHLSVGDLCDSREIRFTGGFATLYSTASPLDSKLITLGPGEAQPRHSAVEGVNLGSLYSVNRTLLQILHQIALC